MTTACHYCTLPVDPDAPSTYRRIEGWERRALGVSRRGGSDITLREQLDVFACPVCIERLRSGLSVGQEALL
jgi:hypothetical protein